MAETIVQEDLYSLITRARIDDALYLTGVLIMEERIAELEQIWIRACCGNELKDLLPSPWKWRKIIEHTYNLVKSESFDIADALLLTTEQCIFYKEALAVERADAGKIHIKQLRNIILEDFPDDAVLSHAGVKRYSRILPEDQEELLFAHRILSGLSRIWTERLYARSRDALEYLSRRKLRLQLPDKSWPSPTPGEADQFLWFLWGAVMCYFQSSEIVPKMFFLFNIHQKKTRKQQRFGLLWHIHHVAGNLEGSPWTAEEDKWLSYVRDNASDIWKQIRETQDELKQTEKALKKASGHGSPADDFDDIFGYVPRTGDRHVVPEETPYQPSWMYASPEPEVCIEKRIKIMGLRSSREPPPSVRKIE